MQVLTVPENMHLFESLVGNTHVVKISTRIGLFFKFEIGGWRELLKLGYDTNYNSCVDYQWSYAHKELDSNVMGSFKDGAVGGLVIKLTR